MTAPAADNETMKVSLEIEIEATPAAVWEALTEGIGAWWPNEFYTGGQEGARTFTLEAEPGGRMYETWDGGGGTLWCTIASVEPGVRLQAMGGLFPNWGGPSIWFSTWELEAQDDGTLLRFSEHTLGATSENQCGDRTKGWTYLFGGVLKAHVEGSPVPAWED